MLPPEDVALLRLAEAVRATGYRFVTPSPATHARVNARPGNEEATTLEDVFGWTRPFRTDILPPAMLALLQQAGVAAREGDLWRSRIRLSSLSGELFIHSAYPTVAGDSVFFGPDTYRFGRAIEQRLSSRTAPVTRAVDIGAGAGPGAILVAKAYPHAEVLMVDINDQALRFAGVNAALAGAGRAVACRSDLLSGASGEFDLVVANPPYLNDPLQRTYRHGGGPLGAALSLRMLDAALGRLAPGGSLILYTGVAIVNGHDPFRAEAAMRITARDMLWSYEEVDPDVFGEELETEAYAAADRIAAVVLTAERRGEGDAESGAEAAGTGPVRHA